MASSASRRPVAPVTLLQRELGDSIDERGLRLRVRLAVETVLRGQTPFQPLVFARDARISTQVVPEGDRPEPLRRADGNEMQMVSPEGWRRLAEPVFEIRLIRGVAVAKLRGRGDRGTGPVECVHAVHDVDHRL